LSNVLLIGVETRSCAACGEREVVTPRLDRLHHAIARSLSRQAAPLQPEAIRFLRTWFGLTVHGFARLMGVDRGTVCRWERAHGACPLKAPADRLLKLLAAQYASENPYPLDLFTRGGRTAAGPIVLVAPDWSVASPARVSTTAPERPSMS